MHGITNEFFFFIKYAFLPDYNVLYCMRGLANHVNTITQCYIKVNEKRTKNEY